MHHRKGWLSPVVYMSASSLKSLELRNVSTIRNLYLAGVVVRFVALGRHIGKRALV
jgi:hypothetical protein